MNAMNPHLPRPVLIVIDGSGRIQQYDIFGFRSAEITIGRSPGNDVTIPEPFVSGHHGRILRNGDRFYYADDNSSNGSLVTAASATSYLKDVAAPVELGNNSVIRIGSAKNPDKRVLIWFTYMLGEEKLAQRDISGGDLTIGRDSACDITLNHPSVSRWHARISVRGNQCGIEDCGSTNGILLNGERLVHPVRLLDKDVIQISGFQLIFSGNRIYYKNRISGIAITARRINKFVGSKNSRKQILHEADVRINASEFVAIIGGSGAGKSTLMNVLNGFDRSYLGEVYYNNISLNENFQSLKSIIGYVPQEDIIYENLTLRKMLQYTAKLRMPKDVDRSEAEAKIDEVLQTLDLMEHQNTLIRKMSGGQKKRASIAVELLADPKLFFLDEPTSGLDPGTEKNLMISMQRLCKEQERTIVMVTHTTQSLHLCDKVIFMGPGGRVCFVGNVEEAKKFFGNDDLTEIYNIIGSDPERWERKFQQLGKATDGGAAGSSVAKYRRGKSSPLGQFATLVARYSELILNDRRKLAILMLEPVLIGLLLFIVAGDHVFDVFSTEDGDDGTQIAVKAYNETKSIMFTLSCAAIWIGLFNSIQEICKERSILKREYMANLGLPVYMGSKVVVQAVIGAVQAVLLSVTFLLLVDRLTDDGNADVWHKEVETIFANSSASGMYMEIILAVWITILSSMALGLIVSSLVKSGDKAMVVAPFLLIVQLLFSGFLFELKGISEKISNLTVSKWSVDSLCRIANIGEIDSGFRDGIKDGDGAFTWDVHELIGDWWALLLMGLICIVISTVLLRGVARDGR